MRNLKKVLALALALVMTLSVLSIATAAFTDEEDINPNYQEAVDVLAALGVFQGRDDGSFDPQASITRAEVAAIIYRIATGDVNDEQVSIYADYNKFEDVSSNQWFAGYVNYCANATYIKGRSDTIFDPDADVTGYEVLAMILRVVGYDQNDEWTGAGWEIKVASTANELGVTNGITGTTLGSAVSREVVAQMLFKAIQVPCVTYTPAFGYNQNTTVFGSEQNESVGYKTFKLVGKVLNNDSWGRPLCQWKLDKDGNKEPDKTDTTLLTYSYSPVAEYTVAEDECDISADLGLKRDATVIEGWIDGVLVTENTYLTGKDDQINVLYSNGGDNLIGDQGRITEIYEVDGEYIIVEINTYLAKVTAVNAPSTDKNGHTGTGSLTLEIYGYTYDEEEDTFVTDKDVTADYEEGYAKNDYVLVTVNNGKVASIEPAEITEAGVLVDYTDRECNMEDTVKDSQGKTVGTVTIGDTTYNMSDKFYLGYPEEEMIGGTYNLIFDHYGNVIGMVGVSDYAATTYAVINAIRWNSPATGTTVGGFVTANLTLADGTVVEDVVVSKINGETPMTADAGPGEITDGQPYVSNAYYLNADAYCGHIITYSVNADGTYSLYVFACDENVDDNVDNLKNATIVNGRSTIYGTDDDNVDFIYASDSTVFLVQDKDGISYTVYVGYNSIPTMTVENICYLVSDKGYIELAVITDSELVSGSSSYPAFVASTESIGRSYQNGQLYYKYNVYPIGSSEPVVILVDADTKASLESGDTGFYTITETKGIASLESKYDFGTSFDLGKTDIADYYTGYNLDIVYTTTGVQSNSIETYIATVTSEIPDENKAALANKDFSNANAATYYVWKDGKLTVGTSSDVKANSTIAIFYTTVTVTVNEEPIDINFPVYVYVAGTSAGGGSASSDQDVNPGDTETSEASLITINGMGYGTETIEEEEVNGFILYLIFDGDAYDQSTGISLGTGTVKVINDEGITVMTWTGVDFTLGADDVEENTDGTYSAALLLPYESVLGARGTYTVVIDLEEGVGTTATVIVA